MWPIRHQSYEPGRKIYFEQGGSSHYRETNIYQRATQGQPYQMEAIHTFDRSVSFTFTPECSIVLASLSTCVCKFVNKCRKCLLSANSPYGYSRIGIFFDFVSLFAFVTIASWGNSPP